MKYQNVALASNLLTSLEKVLQREIDLCKVESCKKRGKIHVNLIKIPKIKWESTRFGKNILETDNIP